MIRPAFWTNLIAAGLMFGSGSVWALSPPHNEINGIDCGDCHHLRDASYGFSDIVTFGKEQEAMCKTCHNPTGVAAAMADVGTHDVDDGATIVDCGSCHVVHFVSTTTDPHAGGATAPNLKLIRDDTDRYIPQALSPAIFQVSPGHLSFVDVPATGICQTCHTQTNYHTNDGLGLAHYAGADCKSCHPHESGFSPGIDHVAAGVVMTLTECAVCHEGDAPVADVHGNNCGLCHLNPGGGGALIEPYETVTPSGGDCSECHSGVTGNHDEVAHSASPGSGSVVIFEDNWHDDAGWVGAKPYFDVTVDCVRCHTTSLKGVHAQNCSTCHPTPYDSLGAWGGTCRQGGCHAVYHEDSANGHIPFEDPYDPENDCNRCHEQGIGAVPQTNCSNCHAIPSAGPLVTTSNAEATYNGGAQIDFITKAGGKVGVGITFYRLDGGPVSTGSSVVVRAAGSHTLEFWSVDQMGRVETPHKQASFAISADTTPPVTTSNAQATYYQYAQITLTATDASNLGVKTTHYKLNGGTTETGTSVYVPGVSGTFAYTLQFWSEDWSDNVETPHTVAFTVTAGTGTFRLVSGALPTSEYWVDWEVWRGSPTGLADYTVSRQGPCGAPCSDDLVVPVTGQQYYVRVSWGEPNEPYDEYDYGYYSVTPGILIVIQ